MVRILAEMGRGCFLTASRTLKFLAEGRAMGFLGDKEDNKILGVKEP